MRDPMAVYIDIYLDEEDDAQGRYRFVLTDGREGTFVVDKATKEFALTKALDGDTDGTLYARAVKKVKDGWRDGSLPRKAVWAS